MLVFACMIHIKRFFVCAQDLRDKAAAPRKEPELERRLKKLEETTRVFEKPLEQLIQSIAGLK